jgi:hypothetical protein
MDLMVQIQALINNPPKKGRWALSSYVTEVEHSTLPFARIYKRRPHAFNVLTRFSLFPSLFPLTAIPILFFLYLFTLYDLSDTTVAIFNDHELSSEP